MLTHRIARRSSLPLLLAVLLIVTAGPAAAQCLISGPASICDGGTVELCGPEGNLEYIWTLPNGCCIMTRCVQASVPGTYALVTYDALGNLFGPCVFTLGTGTAPSAAIQGPASACEGGTVDLCAPAGDFDYAWTGPNGFAASTACVTVGTGGTYGLIVRDRTSGCASAPAEHTVSFAPCGGEVVNCPRAAHWWSRECRRAQRHDGSFSLEALGGIAACVDARAASLAWNDPREGFCATMDRMRPRKMPVRALRQFAAVLANVCAGEVAPARGPAVGLDAATPLSIPGAPPTLGQWIAEADAELVALASRNAKSPEVKAAYRRIIRTAWAINHGEGIGTICPDAAPMRATIEMPADTEAEETLAEELADDPETALSFERPGPNPFKALVEIAYVVTEPSLGEVEIGVYDVAGRLVKTLVRSPMSAGRYSATWDGTGGDGRAVVTGLYVVRGRIGADRVQTMVMRVR